MSKSSTNDGKNPYAKFNFKGTEEVKKAFEKLNRRRKVLPLMSAKEWEYFCKKRHEVQS